VDLGLISLITLNLAATILESVPEIQAAWAEEFFWIEVISVIVFTIEYVLRVTCAVELPDLEGKSPLMARLRYMARPMALMDLLAVLPFYLSAFVAIDLRLLRLLRLLRVLKLTHYFSALETLLDVLRTERNALGAAYFLVAIGILLASCGIYLFEHEAQPEAFASIPAAIYWSIVTLSTVGYGDVVPMTDGGRALGGIVIMLGVGTLTIPTGIMATGFALELRRRRELAEQGGDCPTCGGPRPSA
jgi:voltage-gated potassium channel